MKLFVYMCIYTIHQLKINCYSILIKNSIILTNNYIHTNKYIEAIFDNRYFCRCALLKEKENKTKLNKIELKQGI